MDNNQIVKYETTYGEITLTPAIVKKYLVSGQGSISDQEMMMFLALCKYQKLNPFLREVYLIKYGSEKATMVTGKETFLKRASHNPKYQGHQTGISDDGKRAWAEVFLKDYQVPIRCEVDYEEYVGAKKDGSPNRMWKEKPRTMLKKVALVQALREAFPDDLGGLYSQEEISSMQELDTEPVKIKESYDYHFPELLDTTNFDSLAKEKINYPDPAVDKFLKLTADAQGVNIDQLKVEASKNFSEFWAAFEKWQKKANGKETKNIPQKENEKKPMLLNTQDFIDAIQVTKSDKHLDNWYTKHKKEIEILPETEKAKIRESFKKQKESFRISTPSVPLTPDSGKDIPLSPDKQDKEKEYSCANQGYAMVPEETCNKCSSRVDCPSHEIEDAMAEKTPQGVPEEIRLMTDSFIKHIKEGIKNEKTLKNWSNNNKANLEKIKKADLKAWQRIQDVMNEKFPVDDILI